MSFTGPLFALFSSHVLNMEGKSSTQITEIEQFFNVFANWRSLMSESVR